jgi:hypothetical protein
MSNCKYIFLFILFVFSFTSNAQVTPKFTKYSELNLLIGTSNYVGDMAPYSIFTPALAKPAAGFIYKRNYNRRWNYRLGAYYGYLTGRDRISKNRFIRERNIDFSTHVAEFSACMEFNFFPFEIGSPRFPATFYLFGGFGVFNFNPYREINGQKVELQPLTTESQGTTVSNKKAYPLYQLCMPFGIGGKVSLGKSFALGVELGLRRLFTDYLDDVSSTYADGRILFKERSATSENVSGSIRSNGLEPGNTGRQRGFSWNNDWYSISGVYLTYKIPVKETCHGMGPGY